MTTYLALLRGINVGGRNIIRMADLRTRFEADGYEDVRTYIQSGNVVFRAAETDRERLRHAVESMLGGAFDYEATVELRDLAEMQAIVTEAPSGFGAEPDTYRYNVIFLLPPLTSEAALEALTLKEGIDAAWLGPRAVYTTRLHARATSSGLSRLISHPAYASMTIRNWNTTTRLLTLMLPA